MMQWQRIYLTHHPPVLTWSTELQCAPTAQRFLTSTQKQRVGLLKRAGWTFWIPSPPLVSVSLSGSKWQSVSALHTSTTSTARTVTSIRPINSFSYGCASKPRYYVIGFRPVNFMRLHRNAAEMFRTTAFRVACYERKPRPWILPKARDVSVFTNHFLTSFACASMGFSKVAALGDPPVPYISFRTDSANRGSPISFATRATMALFSVADLSFFFIIPPY